MSQIYRHTYTQTHRLTENRHLDIMADIVGILHGRRTEDVHFSIGLSWCCWCCCYLCIFYCRMLKIILKIIIIVTLVVVMIVMFSCDRNSLHYDTQLLANQAIFFLNSYSPTMSQTQYLPQITASWLMLLSATRGIFVTIDFHWCQHCPNFNHVVIFVTVSSAFFFSLPSGSSWSCSVSRSTW